MSPAPLALRLTGITKRFGSLTANDDISLTLGQGEVLALLGENGAGKSTLVSILFGHYVADAGAIEVFGQPCRQAGPTRRWPRGRHGAPALHAGRQPDRAGQHHGGHGIAVEAGFRRRLARRKLVELGQRFGLAWIPTRASARCRWARSSALKS